MDPEAQEPKKEAKPAKSRWITYFVLRVIAEAVCWTAAIFVTIWALFQALRLTEFLGISSYPPGLLHVTDP